VATSLSATPIFYEALAAVAVCSPADASEHFDPLTAAGNTSGVALGMFFDEYVTPPASE
jgi:hypothetical protein